MPRGNLSKVDMMSKLNRLKEELNREPVYEKDLANKYLNKVLDYVNEFSY